MSGSSENVEAILAAARVIENSNDRSRFLDHACAGDSSLREHIELLLDSRRQTANHVAAPPIQSVGARNAGEPAESEAIPVAEIVPESPQLLADASEPLAPPLLSAAPPVIGAAQPPTVNSAKRARPKSERGSDSTIFIKLVRSRRIKFATAIALIACVLQAIALWVDLRRDDKAANEVTSSSISETRPEPRDIEITLNDSPNIMNVVTGHDNQGIVRVDNNKSITYGEGIGLSSQGKMQSGGFVGPNASRDALASRADFYALTAEDGDTISLVKTCLQDLQDESAGDKRHQKVLFTLLVVEIDDELVPEVRTTVQAYLSETAVEQRAAKESEPLPNRLLPSEVSEQSKIALAILEKLEFTSRDLPFLLQAYDYMPKEVQQVVRRTQDPVLLDGLKTRSGINENDRMIHRMGLMGPVAEPYALPLLRHPDPSVRGATCSLLGKIGTEKSISHLERLSNDAETSIRKQAQDAIEQIRAAGRTPVEIPAANASQD